MTKLLTLRQAAESLAMSPSTLRAMVQTDELVFVQKGIGSQRRHMAFDPKDIEDFVRRRKMVITRNGHSGPLARSSEGFLAQHAARVAARKSKKTGR